MRGRVIYEHGLSIKCIPITDQDNRVDAMVAFVDDVTEVRQLTKELEEEKAFFETFVENANVLMVAVAEHGKRTLWNRHTEEVLGYTREEAHQEFPYSAMFPHPDDRAAILSLVQENDTVRDLELTMRAKNGQEKTVSWSIVKRLGEDGDAFFGIGTDITHRKRLQEELQRDRERLYSILNTMDECVVLEVDRKVLFANDKARQTFGDYEAYFFHSEFPWSQAPWMHRSKTSSGFEMQATNGRWYDFTVSGVQLPGGDQAQLQVARDITEKKANELNNERMASLTQTVTDAIISVDTQWKITAWNPGAERIFGYTAEEVLGTSLSLIYASQDEMDEVIRVIQEKGEFVGERVRPTKNGDMVSVVSSVSPLKNKNGDIEGYMAFEKDVTELRETQRQLFQAQKLECVGTLAGGIAHDFNNILATVIGYAAFLKNAVPPDSPLLPDIEVIEDSANRAIGPHPAASRLRTGRKVSATAAQPEQRRHRNARDAREDARKQHRS